MSNVMQETVLASVIFQRISDLVKENGDMPIVFMEPMMGKELPMSAKAIEVKDGRIEVWPQ